MTRPLSGRPALRALAALAGAATLLLAVGAPASAGTTTPAATTTSDEVQDLPEPGSPDGVWKAWAAQDRRNLERTDWAAQAAARGCVLTSVTIRDEVDAAYNAAMGAPAGLVTARADTVEDCSAPAADQLADAAGGTASRSSAGGPVAMALPSGTRCAGTSGPGTICLYKGGGLLTTSWEYRGSGSVTAFLRIYSVSTGASGCPTGSTWLTGPNTTWSSGQTRSVSKSQNANGGWSAYIWKQVTWGHTAWGSTCSTL